MLRRLRSWSSARTRGFIAPSVYLTGYMTSTRREPRWGPAVVLWPSFVASWGWRRCAGKLPRVNPISFASVECSDPRFERDGLRVITVGSGALGRRADMCFWAPPLGNSPATLPLLILLHGARGSAWSWPL